MENVELSGIIVPLVTPFAVDESFDPQAMEGLIDFVLEKGVAAAASLPISTIRR